MTMVVAARNVLAHTKMSEMLDACLAMFKTHEVIVSEVRLDETPPRYGVNLQTIREFRLDRCTTRGGTGDLDAQYTKISERFPRCITQKILDTLPPAAQPVEHYEAA